MQLPVKCNRSIHTPGEQRKVLFNPVFDNWFTNAIRRLDGIESLQAQEQLG